MQNDTYEKITQRILDLLQQGVCPWRQSWSSMSVPPQNFVSKRPYAGMNFFLLSASSFKSPYYMTFKQVRERGGQIIKGSRGVPVIFWKLVDIEPDKDGPSINAEDFKSIPVPRTYTVFNAEQIKGIRFPEPPKQEIPPFQRIQQAEEIIHGWEDGPKIEHGGDVACYLREEDKILMPDPSQFDSAEEYYSVRFHEMAHATGSKNRLNRTKGRRYGDRNYAREELVAEMTAAFLCRRCGIDNQVVENQAAYIEEWISVFKNDNKILVQAASQAQRAARMIQGEQEPDFPTMEERQKNREFAKNLVQDMADSLANPGPKGIEM